MRNRRLLFSCGAILIALVLVVLPFLTSCTKTSTTTNTISTTVTTSAAKPLTFKIGVLACLTGWFGAHDLIEWQECQMAAQMINDRGGIIVNGQTYNVELVVEDCQSSMDGVTAAANDLIYNKHINFLVGPGAFFPSAVSKICADAKVLDVISFNTLSPGQLGTDTPYTFQGYSGVVEVAAACTTYLHQNYPNVKSTVLLIPDDGSIPYIQPKLTALLASIGVNVLGTVGFDNSATDFSPIAAKLASYKADCVFQMNGVVSSTGNVLKGLRELGYNNLYVGAVAIGYQDIETVAGKQASINFFTESSSMGDPGTPSQMTEIEQKLKDLYGGAPRSFFLQMANCIWELPQVIEKAQSFDPTVVKNTWETMTTVETLFGTGNMGGLQTYGIKHDVAHPMPIQVIDNNGNYSFGGWESFIIP